MDNKSKNEKLETLYTGFVAYKEELQNTIWEKAQMKGCEFCIRAIDEIYRSEKI